MLAKETLETSNLVAKKYFDIIYNNEELIYKLFNDRDKEKSNG